MLLCCSNGYVEEVTLPFIDEQDPETNFNLLLPRKIIKFKSVKSELQRGMAMRRIEARKEQKLAQKKETLARLLEENPETEIDEEEFLSKNGLSFFLVNYLTED